MPVKAENFSLDAYFKRIGFAREPQADIATVRELMRCQLFSVPFENLDVQAGKLVSILPADIVTKVLYQQRGGYCYEVNGIFAMALEALDIPYQFVAARPMFYPSRRPKTHMAIVITLNGEQWLCDLGFGSYGIRAPMQLGLLDVEVAQDSDKFMLSKTGGQEYLLKAWVDGEWLSQYSFDMYPQEWIDFGPANYLNSTHPEAIFVQKLLVVLHTPSGRKILFGDRLKRVEHQDVTYQNISPEQTAAILADEFGLNPAG